MTKIVLIALMIAGVMIVSEKMILYGSTPNNVPPIDSGSAP